MPAELFEVAALIDSRIHKGKPQFLVRWKSYDDPSEHTWEPRAALMAGVGPMVLAREATMKQQAKQQKEQAQKEQKKRTAQRQKQKQARQQQQQQQEQEQETKKDESTASSVPATGVKRKLPEPPAAPSAAAPSAAAGGKSEYELSRERTIQRNMAMLEALGLVQAKEQFNKATEAPKTVRTYSRKQGGAPAGPPRKSKRTLSIAEANARAAEGLEEESEDEWWRPTGERRSFFRSDGRDYGVWSKEANWSLPYHPDRRKSCHVCTQCVASWRGAFSMPLGCSTCPLIWCSRCLSNIFDFDGSGEDGLTIGEVINRANEAGVWSCFKCTDRCACQAKDPAMRRLTPIERHKKWGWVGVTGNRDALCVKPKHLSLSNEVKATAK